MLRADLLGCAEDDSELTRNLGAAGGEVPDQDVENRLSRALTRKGLRVLGGDFFSASICCCGSPSNRAAANACRSGGMRFGAWAASRLPLEPSAVTANTTERTAIRYFKTSVRRTEKKSRPITRTICAFKCSGNPQENSGNDQGSQPGNVNVSHASTLIASFATGLTWLDQSRLSSPGSRRRRGTQSGRR
jgi:hypothetical protein